MLTSYEIQKEKYASYILGNDIEKIKKAAIERNLNEVIESGIRNVSVIENYGHLSDEQFMLRLPEILHTCCFLAFVAIKSGRYDLAGVLGDRGIIHEISHLIHLGQTPETTVSDVKKMFSHLSNAVVGIYLPV